MHDVCVRTKTWAIPQLTCLLSNRMLLTPDCWPGFPKLCLYAGFHLGCGAQLSLTKHWQCWNQALVKGPSLRYCSMGLYGVWLSVKLQNRLVSSSCRCIAYCLKKKEPHRWSLLADLPDDVLWEQNTSLAQKTRKGGGSNWAHASVRCCWSPQRAGEGGRNPASKEFPARSVHQEPWRRPARSEARMKAKPLRSRKGGDIPWDPEELSNPRNHQAWQECEGGLHPEGRQAGIFGKQLRR